jgi:hypothetical protein
MQPRQPIGVAAIGLDLVSRRPRGINDGAITSQRTPNQGIRGAYSSSRSPHRVLNSGIIRLADELKVFREVKKSDHLDVEAAARIGLGPGELSEARAHLSLQEERRIRHCYRITGPHPIMSVSGPPERGKPARTKELLPLRTKVERKINHLQDLGMRKARYRGRRKTL